MNLNRTKVTVPLCLTLLAASCARQPKVSTENLARHTQEMFDAVAPGNKQPWQQNIADDAMYFDEQGHNMNKAALVASIQPLPPGFSGDIKVVDSKFNVQGKTVVHSYDMDETEDVHGQPQHARYHATDTWMYRHGQWQIVAGQVLRYYEDPAPGTPDVRKFRDYVGTYELAGEKAVVSAEGDKLYLLRGARPRVELVPEACDIFFRRSIEGRRLFHYTRGKVDSMIDRRNNEDVVWKKVSGGS